MFQKSIFITLLSVAVLFQACGNKEKEQSQKNKEVKEVNNMVSSNEYVLTSTDDKQYVVKKELDGFVLENAQGKVVIFDIYATWCPPCKASATHLTSLQEKFKDDLVIIGLTIEEDITNAKLIEFAKENNAKYILVNSKQNRPLINEIADALELGGRFPIPLMALYKDGKLINHYVGEVQEEFVESDIKRALGI